MPTGKEALQGLVDQVFGPGQYTVRYTSKVGYFAEVTESSQAVFDLHLGVLFDSAYRLMARLAQEQADSDSQGIG